MRHISIAIIFGALLLQGCDRHSGTKVSKNTEVPQPQAEIQREEAIATTIVPAAYSAPIAEKTIVASPVAETVFVEEEAVFLEEVPVIYEDEILIQAEEERSPKNRGKTYNELQKSDDMDDYPFSPSTDDYNYNERQFE
jgi:hypothetical protein